MPAVKVATKSTSKPAAKRSNTAKPKAAAAKSVSPTVVTLKAVQMPKGKGGIKFVEQNVAEGDEVLRTLYVSQSEFARLGLSEGDSITVTIEKA